MSSGYTASALRGVYVCERCGNLVANADRHDDWHASSLNIRFDAAEARRVFLLDGHDIPLNDIREAFDAALWIGEDR